jgi:hypothetical protein
MTHNLDFQDDRQFFPSKIGKNRPKFVIRAWRPCQRACQVSNFNLIGGDEKNDLFSFLFGGPKLEEAASSDRRLHQMSRSFFSSRVARFFAVQNTKT